MKILNARQEAKLNMYQVVKEVCESFPAIIGINAAFLSAYNEFRNVVAALVAASEQSAAVITGIAADKKVSKKELSRIGAKVAGLIYAYAAKNGNNTMKDAVNFSASDLLRSKDAEIAPRCQTIHDLGRENRVELEQFGVTTAKLEELQDAINSYSSAVPKPRTALVNRSTLKANIKAMFTQADAILAEQMDRLVEDLTETEPDFVTSYKKARKVINPKPKKKNGEDPLVSPPM